MPMHRATHRVEQTLALDIEILIEDVANAKRIAHRPRRVAIERRQFAHLDVSHGNSPPPPPPPPPFGCVSLNCCWARRSAAAACRSAALALTSAILALASHVFRRPSFSCSIMWA